MKKVASRVSGLIPRSTSWLSGWFSPTSAQGEGPIEREEQVPNEEDNFQDALEKPPPAKRFRLTSNQEYVDTYLGNQNVNQGKEILLFFWSGLQNDLSPHQSYNIQMYLLLCYLNHFQNHNVRANFHF